MIILSKNNTIQYIANTKDAVLLSFLCLSYLVVFVVDPTMLIFSYDTFSMIVAVGGG